MKLIQKISSNKQDFTHIVLENMVQQNIALLSELFGNAEDLKNRKKGDMEIKADIKTFVDNIENNDNFLSIEQCQK